MNTQLTEALTLTPRERLARARADLRAGVPVVLSGKDGGFLFAPAETLTPARLDGLRACGEVVLALTARRAETLKCRVYDRTLARIALPTEANVDWVAALADPATDLMHPMKGPLMALRDGDATLPQLALTLTKSARLLPAICGVSLPGSTVSTLTDLSVLEASESAQHLNAKQRLMDIAAARVPLRVSDKARVHVFRPDDGGEEHYAVEIGRPDRSKPVLSRLHSACFTGDLLGSLKCDCGPQFQAALTQMADEGTGVLLYLNQEGRGIGLANKMRAYSLQDQGFDTVEANHRLGFEDDERDFRLGAAILKEMGFSAVRLMTNNPAKVNMLRQNGLNVTERLPLKVGETHENRAYLATKAKKSGHLL